MYFWQQLNQIDVCIALFNSVFQMLIGALEENVLLTDFSRFLYVLPFQKPTIDWRLQ